MKLTNLSSCIRAAFAVLALTLFAACSKSTPDFARLIPKETPVVVRLDLKQMAEKAGEGKGDAVSAKLKQNLEQQGLSPDLLQKAKAIVDDPAEAGVDLREPLVLYVSDANAKSGGLAGKLHDADKFGQLVTALAAEAGQPAPQADGDLHLLYYNGVQLAYDADAFLICTVKGTADDAAAYAKQRFAAEDDASLRARDDFKEMCKAEADVQLLVSGIALRQLASDADVARALALLPADLNPDDYSSLMSLNFETGQVVLHTQSIALTDQAKDYMKKNQAALGKVSDKFLAYVPENALFAAAANVDGEKLCEQLMPFLEKEGKLKDDEKNAVRQVLGSLKGDVLMALCGFDTAKGPAGVNAFLLAEAKSVEGLNTIVNQYGKGMFQETSPAHYTIAGQYYMGIEDDVFYLSTEAPFKDMKKADRALDADGLDGGSALAVVNLKAILGQPMLRMMLPRARGAERAALGMMEKFDRAEFKAESGTEGTLRLKLTDPKANLLQQLADLAGEQLNG